MHVWRQHGADVSKKPSKVGEAKAAYPAKKAATAKLGKAAPDGPEFQAISSKLLKERKELLHKLAQ